MNSCKYCGKKSSIILRFYPHSFVKEPKSIVFYYRSMKGNLKIQTYCFNQPFQLYQKQELADAFFQDPIVVSTLLGMSLSKSWAPVGKLVTTVYHIIVRY